MSRSLLVVAIAVQVVGLASGCVSPGLDLAELPTDPIAVLWWEPEDARRRAEQQEQQQLEAQKRGVARVEELGELLGARQTRGASRFPGQLSFVDPLSAEVRPVHAIPRGSIPLAWSGDHQRLLFLSNHRGSVQVYEYDRESDEVRPITRGPNAHHYADYGRDRQLAYLEVVNASREDRQDRIWVTDLDGGSPRIAVDRGNLRTARLSPDGKTLVYVRVPPAGAGREPIPELVSQDLASGAEEVLGPGREPSFSPIGGWIVYSAPSREGWRLRRMRPDGSARSPVLAGIRDEKMPSVSPDGQFVVYVGEATGLERLFVRRMDGSGDRVLLDSGAVHAPAW